MRLNHTFVTNQGQNGCSDVAMFRSDLYLAALTMTIDFQDTPPDFRRIVITGRLDIPGTDAIADRFAALAATTARRIVVDLTGVTFLASIGIRSLITNAKALQHRGGRMVLLVGENTAVRKTLEATGMDTLIPTFTNSAAADAALA